MKRLKILFWSGLFLMFTAGVYAQTYPLSVTVNIAPPYTNRWQDYTGNGNRIQVRVTNNTSQPFNFYLSGTFLKIPERNIGVQALATPIPNQRLNIAGGINMMSVYSGTQLAQFFVSSATSVQAVGLTDEELSRGVMPEGTYQLCLVAYDNQGQPLSNPLEGCSAPIQISWLLPPRLTMPLCESIVRANPVQQVTFNWTPPSGAGLVASQMAYRYTLVEVPEGMDPNYALNNATYPVLDTTVPVTSLNYTNANPPLISGRTYAWRVQALDRSSTIGMLNNGLSQPCSFTYSEGFQAQLVYPALNEWIPFTGFPVIVQFSPYSNTYKRFESSLTFSNSDISGNRNRTLRWPNGPISSQQDVGVPVVNTQQASQITVFPTTQEPNYLQRYQRGGRYSFSGTVRIGYQLDNAPLTAGIRGQFNIGMSPSTLSLPANNDTVAPGKVRFSFKTADRPSKLIPDFFIQQRQRGEASPSYYDGEVLEKWVLEVSQNQQFTGKIDTIQGSVGGRKRLLGITNAEALAAELYRDMEREIQIDSAGKYWWRVKWVNKPDSESDTSAYQYSSTFIFHVKNRGNGRVDTTKENPTPSSCIALCDEPMVTNRVTSTQAAVGQIVQIGKFAMTIQEIEWLEGKASGKGAIAIPFMNTRVLVNFNNLQINTESKVIDGVVNAEYETQQLPNLGNGSAFLTSLSGMTETQLNTLTGFISQSGRLISQLSGSNPLKLPLGIDNRVGDQQYIIGVVGMRFTPERATLNALIRLDIEGTYGWLSLGASDLCFHPRGLAGTGRGFLYNPADKIIPFGSTRLIFKQTQFAPGDYNTIVDSGTYVRWDCEGFKALQIKGEIVFGTDVALKELPNGNIASDSVVKSQFRATLRQAKNFVFTFTMDRFQSPFARGYGFEVQEAILDLSDFETPDGVRFPANYPFTQAKPLWRGFYLGRMAMHFPPDFQGTGGRRLSMSIGGIIIDRNGLSCDLKLRNIVSPDNCTVDGLAFGIDSVNFRMVANNFNDAGMYGRFKLPISPQMLTYACVISSFTTPVRGTQYSFRVGSADTLDVPLWLAKLKLSPGTTFGINYTSVASTGGGNPQGAPQSGFALEADLHGEISIKGFQQPVGEIDFPLVRFQNLRVQTREPYIGCGPGGGTECVRLAFGQASPAKSAGGFPVSLDSVFLDVNQSIHLLEIDKSPGARVGIGAKISIITEQNKNSTNTANRGSSFQCTSVLRFRGRLGTNPLGWVPTGLVADSVIVKGRGSAVDLDGRLVFYADDAVYGSGFKGEIKAEIKPGFRLRAFAQFGTVQTTDYWFVDGMFAAPQGIPLGASGIAFYGFGGGAYRNMRMEGTQQVPTSGTADSSRLTRTQLRYIPDLRASTIGIRATIALGAIKKEMFYGEGTLDVAVSPTDGLQSIALQGNCWFFKNNSGTDNTVRGNFNFVYLHPARTFDGNIAVYVNVLGGKLKGIGADDLAGRMQMHFAPETWFIKLGEPVADITKRIGLQFEVTSSIKPRFSAYLAAGRQLPPIPEPATTTLRALAASIPANNVSLATESDGFMFGASAELNTGPQTVADFFRYSFGVELGFDFALKDLNRVQCASPSGNGSFTPGMNGWYAQGQLYAGVNGALGIKLPVLMSDYVNVVDFGANFIIRGGFVNPTYMDGIIQARLRVLGGLIDIPDARLPFQIGEKCRVVQESPMANVELISDLTPPHDPQGRNKVDLTANPQLMANFPIGRPFSLETLDENGQVNMKYFRVVVDRLSLTNLDSNTAHPFVQLPDPAVPEQITLVLDRAMNPNTRYSVAATLSVNFATVANPYASQYQWVPARKADNSLITESKRNDFVTGAVPVRLRDDQVFHAYPIRNQRYLLQAECPKGYIALGQETNSVVFRPDDRPGVTTNFFIRYIPLDGSHAAIEVPFTRGSSSYTPPPPSPPSPLPDNYVSPAMPRIQVPVIQFDIPSLRNSKVYALQIIRKVTAPATASGGFQYQTSFIDNPQLQMMIRKKMLGPLASGPGETVVYQYFFRTSQFNTLIQKVDGFTVNQARRETQWILRDLVNIHMSHQEPWEEYDVMETTMTSTLGLRFVYRPLIRMATNLTSPWASQFVMPQIYQLADRLSSFGGSMRRSPQQIFRRLPQGDPGIPPWKSVYLSFEGSTVAGSLRSNETMATNPMIRSQLVSPSQFVASGLPNGLNANLFAFPSGYSSRTTLSYYLPNQTQFDWAALRSYVQRLVAVYGQPETSEFFPIDMRPAIRRVLNNQYEYMRAGNYEVIFRFNPPFGQCATTDESANLTGAVKSISVQ